MKDVTGKRVNVGDEIIYFVSTPNGIEGIEATVEGILKDDPYITTWPGIRLRVMPKNTKGYWTCRRSLPNAKFVITKSKED